MLKIGLTGGIGSGKTTIAEMFSARGAKVLNADVMVHELIKCRNDIKEQILTLYGTDILDCNDGSIDRGKLAKKCFGGKQDLEPLLSIVYPELRKEVCSTMKSFSAQGAKIFVFDAPVLLEAGFESLFDGVVLVSASHDIKIKRLLDKDFAVEQIKARIHFQWPDWVKARYADFIIDNSGSLKKTKEKFNKIFTAMSLRSSASNRQG
ncbi:MAG: dephospho-CoA kinase [bacterium]